MEFCLNSIDGVLFVFSDLFDFFLCLSELETTLTGFCERVISYRVLTDGLSGLGGQRGPLVCSFISF